MHVSQEPPPREFRPITILIRNEKEADYLWHRLQCASEHGQANTRRPRRVDEFSPQLRDNMFREFDRVFRPEDVREY